MGEHVISEMVGSWLFWLVGSVATSSLIVYVTIVAPAEAGRRARRGAPPRSSIEPDQDEPADRRIDTEQAMAVALLVHADRIAAAHEHLIEARVGTTQERLRSLDRALELLAEATMARIDSHEAAEARARVHLQRAELMDDEAERDAALRRSAEAFMETAELRPRELDAYLGAGAVWLRLARRWRGDAAIEALDVAAATYERAFEQARNNLALMQAWGVAIDGLARAAAPSYPVRRGAFDVALREHRGGEHDLAEWLRATMARSEAPPAPRIAPLVARQRPG